MSRELPYQPLLFPDEVYEVWADGRAEGHRAAEQIQRWGHDRPPPGWPSGTRFVEEREGYGVGVAGVMPSEIK